MGSKTPRPDRRLLILRRLWVIHESGKRGCEKKRCVDQRSGPLGGAPKRRPCADRLCLRVSETSSANDGCIRVKTNPRGAPFAAGPPHLAFALRERGTRPYGESFTRLTRQSLPEAGGDKLLPRNAGKSNEVSESQSPPARQNVGAQVEGTDKPKQPMGCRKGIHCQNARRSSASACQCAGADYECQPSDSVITNGHDQPIRPLAIGKHDWRRELHRLRSLIAEQWKLGRERSRRKVEQHADSKPRSE